MLTITIRKKWVASLAALAVITVTTVAIAAWTVSATGNGSAKAATATALTLSDASGSTSANLYPGATAALQLRVANPNAFPVRITAVAANGTITSDKAGCDSTTSGVTFTDQSGLTIDLAANAAAADVTVSGAVHMSTSAANACQGAIFTIPVSVTAASN